MACSYYPAILSTGDQGYIAQFTDFPVRSSGATACDAASNAIDALTTYVKELRRSGARLPLPSGAGHSRPGFAEQDTYILVAVEP